MQADAPGAPPEAMLIRLAREASGMTAQAAAEATRAHDGKGVSPAYWRDVERGYGGRRGQRVPARASARVLAMMARAVGVEPGQLTEAGREDAARVLDEILRREQPPAAVVRHPADEDLDDDDILPPEEQARLRPFKDEIWDLLVDAAARTHTPDPAGREIFGPGSQAELWDLLRNRPRRFRVWVIAGARADIAGHGNHRTEVRRR